MLAPIVLFAYNRLDCLKHTVSSLQGNILSAESELYIYVDGPKNEIDKIKVEEVHSFLDGVSGFKQVYRCYKKANMGLASSVITGVTEVIEKHGKVIVVEDDLILSTCFLIFMNQMLDEYEANGSVFQVTGFGLKVKKPIDYPYDIYFHNRAHSWSWGTWKDRWKSVDWDIMDWADLKNDISTKRAFNKGGSDLFKMLNDYMHGRNNSWYIRFTYNMFKQNKFAVTPIQSLVINDGFRADATHCNVYNRYKVDFLNKGKEVFRIPGEIAVSWELSRQASQYFSIRARIYGKIMNLISKL